MDTRTDPAVNRYCSRPWSQTTFLSDGTAVCACIDAGRTNPLGNIRERSFEEIWNGPEYQRLRSAIAGGDIDSVPICRGCPNRISDPPPGGHGVADRPKPKALYLESVAACNLVCPGCDRESIEGTRDGRLVMDWATYQKIVDALSPGLEYMEYHLGGENFMHKQWPRMIRYAKEKNPRVFVVSSTNGHYFRTEQERRDLVTCGIDGIIFSIDGASQETYVKYRVGGRFDAVIENMRGCLEARRALGLSRPYVVWRYILFDWNDSPEEMDRARRMAREIGVDLFAWHLNVAAPAMSSKRYYIGSPHNAEIATELWDNVQNVKLPGVPEINVTAYPAA
jgi:MoaA/NifB/PqqE/SkfB family radical SAM enzyme